MIQPPRYLERAREIAARVKPPHGRIAAKAKDSRGELFLYDEIGESMFSQGITAKDIAEKLDELKGVSALDIYINSPGGSVFEGISILSMLERFPASKTVYVDGIAASIASVIAMAADRVVMHRSATMMIHDPYSLAVGNAEELRKEADVLDKVAENIVAAYQKRTGKGPSDLRKMMRAETWMTAQEAVDHRFAAEIQDPGEEHSPSMPPHKKAAAASTATAAESALSPQARFDLAVARARALSEQFAGAGPGNPGQPGTKHNSPATAGKGK
jgi:ATP-dependent Clp protease protease subunit